MANMTLKNTISVKNRSAGRVVYSIPDLGIRRDFSPGEVKRLSREELESLSYIPGGQNILNKYLFISNQDVVEELSVPTEPEYYMSEQEIKDLILTGSQDAWLDALDFAPVGVIDLIKKFSVELPLTDMNKIASLKAKTGFDAKKAIEMTAPEATEEEVAQLAKPATRRRTSGTKSAQKTRRTTKATAE